MTKREHRPLRKLYLINPVFQKKVILYSIIAALVYIAAAFATVNLSFWQLQEESRAIGLPDGHPFFMFVSSQQSRLNLQLLGLAAFTMILFSVFGIILSHKIAGPLYRLHRHMQQVASDEATSPLKFRKSDFFQELCQSYNAQYEALSANQPAPEKRSDASA